MYIHKTYLSSHLAPVLYGVSLAPKVILALDAKGDTGNKTGAISQPETNGRSG